MVKTNEDEAPEELFSSSTSAIGSMSWTIVTGLVVSSGNGSLVKTNEDEVSDELEMRSQRQ